MPSSRLLKYVSVFAATFIIGIAWVGLFRFVFGSGETASVHKSKAVHKLAESEQVSMDDPMFTAPSVDETNPDAFDPEGIYEVSEDLPAAFNDFGGFVLNNKKLDVACDSKDFGELTVPTGFAYSELPAKSEIESNTLKVSDFKLAKGPISFVTENKNGTSFQFEGEFLIKGNFYTLDPDAKVLSGRLIKFQDGKKVAETDVSFTWSIDLTCVC